MSKKIIIKKVDSVESLGHMSDEELTRLSEEFEPENYNPEKNIENREETMSFRVSKSEKKQIIAFLRSNGYKRSEFMRNAILKSLNDNDTQKDIKNEIHEIYNMLKEDIETNKEIKKKCIKCKEYRRHALILLNHTNSRDKSLIYNKN